MKWAHKNRSWYLYMNISNNILKLFIVISVTKIIPQLYYYQDTMNKEMKMKKLKTAIICTNIKNKWVCELVVARHIEGP